MTSSRRSKQLILIAIICGLQTLTTLFAQDIKSSITVIGDVEKSGEFEAPSTVAKLLTESGVDTEELLSPNGSAIYELWLYRDGKKITLNLNEEIATTLKQEIQAGSSLQVMDYRKIEKRDLPDGNGWMHQIFFQGEIFGKPVALYPWKLIGYFGVMMFAGRWFPQMLASKKAKQVKMPRVFWIMSVLGSLSLLSYFTLGKTDSVGVLSNLFPSFVGLYNLILDLKTGPAPKKTE